VTLLFIFKDKNSIYPNILFYLVFSEFRVKREFDCQLVLEKKAPSFLEASYNLNISS